MHPLNQLRKAREDGLAKAQDPKLAFVTRAELDEFRDEFRDQFAAAFADLAAAVGLTVGGEPFSEEADELEDLGEIETVGAEPVADEPEEIDHKADEDGIELVEKILARKARKPKPEPETGAQPLDGLDLEGS